MRNLTEAISEIKDKKKLFQLGSTIKTLSQIDDVINYHNNNFTEDTSLVVINIYGILQSLFVGIDSLYSLVIGLTNNKFNINVNQNKTLNGLKHIRNDIVGHPTNRRYGQDGIAYSVIDNTKLTYNEFKYYTFIFINNEMETKEVIVNLTDLKNEYSKEKNIIIKRLEEFVNKDSKTIDLDNEILQFFYNSTIENLELIRTKFIKYYGNLEEHRFIWRTNLIEFILNLHVEDPEIVSLVNYLLKHQTVKLLEINNEMESKYSKLPYVKIPPVLRKIYKYMDKNPDIVEYTSNLHDNNNPFFESDLNYLLTIVKEPSFQKVLLLLKNSDKKEIIYLIGSVIKNYKKKN